MLTDRQQREQQYHVGFAKQHQSRKEEPVRLDIIRSAERRPWNGYWTAYDFLMAEAPLGKRVLVPGCGFGDDAIRLSVLGAEVFASDLSSDLLGIAKRRAERMDVPLIQFGIMPAETYDHDDNFFDLVFFNDILHHVDIPKAVAEARRVLRPGGRIIANELYTHSSLQKIRESWFVSRVAYPRMVSFIYGQPNPYITDDERKINEEELSLLEAATAGDANLRFFRFVGGRILPACWPKVEKFDRIALNFSEAIGRRFAGRVVLAATIRK